MANQLSNDQLLNALRGEGLTVREYAGWRDRCRCHTGSHQAGGAKIRAWEPVNGIMVHITAGGLGSRSVEGYIRDIINGDSATPCKVQFVVAPDGVVWINSGGRSNHAGTISSRSLAAVQSGTLSLDGWQDLRGHDVDGNTHLYGIENIAATSMTEAQRQASIRICAAICRAYGWSGRDVIGHGEASDQRSYGDPNLDMGRFRRDVMARVAGPQQQTTPQSPQEDDLDMAERIYNTSTDSRTVAAGGALDLQELLRADGKTRAVQGAVRVNATGSGRLEVFKLDGDKVKDLGPVGGQPLTGGGITTVAPFQTWVSGSERLIARVYADSDVTISQVVVDLNQAVR